MPDPNDRDSGTSFDVGAIGPWMRTRVSITLERWVLVAAGLVGFILVLVALD